MVSKSLNYGFNGYQASALPQVPKSAKGKRSARKKVVSNDTYAFDLLAAVAAAELPIEKDSHSSTRIINGASNPSSNGRSAQGQLFEEKSLKDEVFDQVSCSENAFDLKLSKQRKSDCFSKEHLQNRNGMALGSFASMIKSDGISKDIDSAGTMSSIRGQFGYFSDGKPKRCRAGTYSPFSTKFWEDKLVNTVQASLPSEELADRSWTGGHTPEICSLQDPLQSDSKSAVFFSSDSIAEVPLVEDCSPLNSSFPEWRDDLELFVNRDDDENSYRFNNRSTITNKAFRRQYKGNRKIRELLASNCWRTTSTRSKHGQLLNTDVDKKPESNRKICCTRVRTNRYPFKRKKLSFSKSCPLFCYSGVFRCEYTNVAENDMEAETSNSCATSHKASKTTSTITGQRTSHESEEFRGAIFFDVKLRINSFKVPDIFIDTLQTDTVGSLKKTIAKEITAMLGGRLRVGLILQGKKIRDDSKTLLQAGIAHGAKLDSLGFSLEPIPTSAPSLLASPDEPQRILQDDGTEPLARLQPAAAPADTGVSVTHPELSLPTLVNSPSSDHDSVCSPGEIASLDKITADSKALVPIPPMSNESLPMAPMYKPKRSEVAQRRIRRPFSVFEVEALVQAVENLGTGRWRDVKIRAFNDADHRTYVDLKDKWKTLVHTATISPQQRRGEPVPQELLERVLAAHAYWTERQAKLPVRTPPAGEICQLN